MVRAAAHGRLNGPWLDIGLAVAGLASLACVFTWPAASAEVAGQMLTRNTVRLSLAWYTAAAWLMMRLRADDWAIATARGRLARWCWSWAMVAYLAHLAMAFEHYHHWSHAEAFEHTRLAGGFGEGIYASYLFTLLWAADVAWWWIGPARYAGRPAWIDRTLHGFMLFIIFNGTVIFGRGLVRWAGVMMFAGLLVAWILRRRHPGPLKA